MPVAEHAVKFLQVVERGAGRCQHVAPIVAKHVLLQVEVAPGRGNELPHAGGLGRRHRLRVEGAFNERQQRQLAGHAAAFHFFDDVEEVAAATLRHALHVIRP